MTIEEKLSELLDVANDQAPSPGRLRLVRGRERAIALLWVDGTSPRSLNEEIRYKRTKESKERMTEILRLLSEKMEQVSNLLRDKRVEEAESVIQECNALNAEMKAIKQSWGQESPAEKAFKILSVCAHTVEEYYHDTEKMEQFFMAMIAARRECEQND